MVRTLIIDTLKKTGKTVLLKGWVNSRRDHGKIVFIDLRDRTGLVQVVLTPDLAGSLHSEDVAYVTGLVKSRPEKLVNPKLPTGTVEIEAQKVETVSQSADLPFDMGGETLNLELPTLLDYRPLTLRHPMVNPIFKVQEVVIDSFRRSLQSKDFFEFQAPVLIPEIAEGGSEVFKVPYFGHEVYLSQSPQLYKQILVGAYERVFSVNKTLRAEPSMTTRHLTEVTTLDAEFGFINSWLDVKNMAEFSIKYILESIKKNCGDILAKFGVSPLIVPKKIPMIKLKKAQEIIFQRTGRDNRQEPDLQPEDEREICRWAVEEYNSDLIFISHYPVKKRPFYTYPDPKDPEYTMSFDLLGKGTEWMTGGRRINDYDWLIKNAKLWKADPEKLNLYLQAFKYGMPPEGGFSFGSERIVMNILGLKNIREASLFPRDMERVDIRLSTIKRQNSDEKVFDSIKAKLKESGIKYKLLEHQPVFTSEESARARNTKLEQGAKALVMYADKKPVLFVLSAAKKTDTKKQKALFGINDLRMATAEEVKQLTGLEIGSIPPFGSIIGLKTYLDESLSDNSEIAFNAGLHTKSILMNYSDFVKIENPQIGDFSE